VDVKGVSLSILSKLFSTRIKTRDNAPNTYVAGDLFDAGAENFAYEPLTATTPNFWTRVYPQWNFTPLQVTQPEMDLQLLTLPPSPPQGFPFGGFQPTGLIDPTQYPDISGDYYQ